MTSDILLTILLVSAGLVGFAVWVMWRHHAEHRNEALLYESDSRVPPPSTVCPQCRRRSYGRRAIAERYCEPCDLHYGQHAAA